MSTKKVHRTELGGSNFEIDSPSEVTEALDYDVHASATTLLANMTNRGDSKSNVYLPSEYYALLSPEEKYLWVKFTSDMKHVTLKGKNSNKQT